MRGIGFSGVFLPHWWDDWVLFSEAHNSKLDLMWEADGGF